MQTFEHDTDRDAYWAMILRVIRFFHPTCSDYQIWRGISGKDLDLKYQGALYPVIDAMKSRGFVVAARHPDYPNFVYSITDAGQEWLADQPETEQARR